MAQAPWLGHAGVPEASERQPSTARLRSAGARCSSITNRLGVHTWPHGAADLHSARGSAYAPSTSYVNHMSSRIALRAGRV